MNGLDEREHTPKKDIVHTHLIFALTLPNSSFSGIERSDERRVRAMKKLKEC